MRIEIIMNIFLTRVIIRGLAAAADQRGNSVQLLGLTQDGRVEAVGQVLLVHCHQHFGKVCSPKHQARSTFSTFVILEMYIQRLVIIVLVVVVININCCLTLL